MLTHAIGKLWLMPNMGDHCQNLSLASGGRIRSPCERSEQIVSADLGENNGADELRNDPLTTPSLRNDLSVMAIFVNYAKASSRKKLG